MKKLVNDPRAVVPEMLEGLVALAPGQALLEGWTTVLRAGLPPPDARREVALVSGGGSGHEPAHAGYVGPGMLHAAVAGDVFASPPVDAVLAAIRAVAGPPGALLIVKNYTGDRLNFGLAAEIARGEGIAVEVVTVADDVSLRGSTAATGRRGIAGTVLVHKVAGAAAAAGLPLGAVRDAAQGAAAAVATMGVGLTPCTVPAAGAPGFALEGGEMELGLGIHGERGVRRAPLAAADAVVEALLAEIAADQALTSGDRVALLVNGLGGTPAMELGIVARHALASLRRRGVVVERAWAGTFLSALEMAGCSLSVMRLDDERLRRLDAPASAPAWPGGGRVAADGARRVASPAPASATPGVPEEPPPPALVRAVHAVAAALRAAEPHLTELDRLVGDGDLGAAMARGADAAEAALAGARGGAAETLARVADAVRREVGGTSGPLYAALLLRAGRALGPAPDPSAWAGALEAGAEAVAALGGARPGDRTMLDALLPGAQAFADGLRGGQGARPAWEAAVAAAETGAAATAAMTPRLGRSSYLGERALGTPDPGAVAVVTWMRALGS